MGVTVKDLIHSYETVEHDKFETELLKWLVNEGYFLTEQEVPLDYKREVPKEAIDEFRHSQEYDILVFGNKVWLIHEKVSYEEASRICSDERTKGENWFAGFAIHGQYKNLPRGHELPLKPKKETKQMRLFV